MILQAITEVGFLNMHAGAQQNENANLKSRGCCVAVGDGFMPVASAGRLEAFSSVWWAVVQKGTTVQPEGLLWGWDAPGLFLCSFLCVVHVLRLHARPSLASLPLPWLGRTGGGWVSWETWLPYSCLIGVRSRLRSLFHLGASERITQAYSPR